MARTHFMLRKSEAISDYGLNQICSGFSWAFEYGSCRGTDPDRDREEHRGEGKKQREA